jgi:MFS family permease
MAAQAGGVVLLVAIQYFDASSLAKAMLSAAVFIGLLLAPVTVTFVAVRQVRVNRALAFLQIFTAAGWVVAAASNSFAGFFVGVMVGVPILQSSVPLVTAIWQRNVSATARGKLFGLATSLATLSSVVAGLLIAWFMGDDPGRYRPVMLVLALLLFLGAIAALQLPEQRLRRSVRNPVRLLSLLRENKVFGFLSIVWMLLGFGNLASWPLRTEYIASGKYGFAYTPQSVLILTVVIPLAVTLVATPLWGRFFDQADFVRVRLSINIVFMLSIVFFFQQSLPSQVLGAVMLGLGRGGGLVAWNLWVTKYAPPDRTADYMSVHTFLTGTRGIVAPLLAYALLEPLSLITVTHVSLALITLASLLLLPLLIRPSWAPTQV